MSIRLHVAAVIVIAMGASSAKAQVGANQRPVRDRLRSPDMATRIAAFESLRQPDLVALGKDGTLLQLLIRENNVILEAQRAVVDVDTRYGEGYVEYYSSVLGACNGLCNRSDAKVNAALAESAYNTDSPFAIELARDHGPEVLPVLLKRSQSPVSVVRSNGIRMLATVSENSKALTVNNRRAIHQRVLAAVNDSTDVGVRIAGIYSLGAVGDSSDLPLLQGISASRSRAISKADRGLGEFADVAIKKLKARLSAK
jgi:hypothetical protein